MSVQTTAEARGYPRTNTRDTGRPFCYTCCRSVPRGADDVDQERRMRKHMILVALAVAIPCSLCATPASGTEPARMAVADFKVSSDNNKLRYVGKGLAEMVAAELAQSPGLLVIDRAKREELLGEMEFALSDAADSTKTLQLGKLLAAQFLLCGEIIDMGEDVLLSCRLTEVETAAIVWTDKSLGELSDYDALSRRIAVSLLASRGLGPQAPPGPAAPTTAPKNAAETQRRERAIVAFSAAVDALDRNDVAEATRQVKVAAAADRRNRAVRALFDKLVAPSPRYQPEIEFYTPIASAANEAMAQQGAIGAWVGFTTPGSGVHWGDYRSSDSYAGIRLTRSLPIGNRFSVVVEAGTDSRSSDVVGDDHTPVLAGSSDFIANCNSQISGVRLGLGYRIGEVLAVGLSGLYGKTAGSQTTLTDLSGTYTFVSQYRTLGLERAENGVSASLAFRNRASTLFAGLQVSWDSLPSLYVAFPSEGEPGELRVGYQPLVIEGSAAARIPESRLFGSLRLGLEQDLDERGTSLLRAQPIVEWWALNWFTFRFGVEYNLQARSGSAVSGLGLLGGASLVLGKFDISINAMQSGRPVRALPLADPSAGPDHDAGLLWGIIDGTPRLLIGVS